MVSRVWPPSNVFGRFTEVRARCPFWPESRSCRGPIPDRRPACGSGAIRAMASARAAHAVSSDLTRCRTLCTMPRTRAVFVLDRHGSPAEAERLHGRSLIGLLPDHAAHRR